MSFQGHAASDAYLIPVQEFSIEIPDKEADAIHSGTSIDVSAGISNTDDTAVKQAVDYIMAQPDGKKTSSRACLDGKLTGTAH